MQTPKGFFFAFIVLLSSIQAASAQILPKSICIACFQIAVVSGDRQTAPITGPLPNPLVVRVTDANGVPLVDAPVVFTLSQTPSGAGGVKLNSFSIAVGQEVQVSTASDGTASVQMIVGSIQGAYQVTASIALSTVTFSEIATACQVNVTRLSQGDLRWANDHYDHKLWLSPLSSSPFKTPSWFTSTMELAVAGQTFPVQEANLANLAHFINRLETGIAASVLTIPQGNPAGSQPPLFQLAVTDTVGDVCAVCGGDASAIQLRTIPGNLATNQLTTKSLQNRGCYLSSLAMAVGVAASRKQVPDLPDSLNSFMIEQDITAHANDYSPGGDVGPGATVAGISRSFSISLQWNPAQLRSQAPLFTPAVTQYLDNALCTQQLPVIVGVANDKNHHPALFGAKGASRHFVLVTGKQLDANGSADYTIADPGFGGRGVLSDYPEFETRGFVSDPSPQGFVSISIEGPADSLITDPDGKQTGFDSNSGLIQEIPNSVYFVDAIDDDVDFESETVLNHSVEILQPTDGTYNLTVTGTDNGFYSLGITTIAANGTLEPTISMMGVTQPGLTATIRIQLASTPGSAPEVQRVVTFRSTLDDITSDENLGFLDERKARILAKLIQRVQEEVAEGEIREAKHFLKEFEDALRDAAKDTTPTMTVEILLEDANSLINQLPKSGDRDAE